MLSYYLYSNQNKIHDNSVILMRNVSKELLEKNTTHMYYTYVPHICTTHMYHTYVLHICTTHMYYTYVLHICTTHMYHTYVPHICTTHMYCTYVLHICTTHMYYTYVLHICTTHMYHTYVLHYIEQEDKRTEIKMNTSLQFILFFKNSFYTFNLVNI